jgi:hypothetical protein
MKRILFIMVLFLSALGLSAQPITYAPQIVTTAGQVGNTLQVPITVDNFNDVGAISLKLQYLPSVMTWNGLSGWTENLVTGFLVFEPVAGEINIVWIAITGAAPTLPNGSTLITLNFTLNTLATSPLTWLDPTGTECEFQSWSTGLPFTDTPFSSYWNNGWVSGMELPPLTVTDPTCFGWTDGSVAAYPINGTGPFTYNWSGPITSGNPALQVQNNLGDGTYNVTVTDFYGITKTASATLTHLNSLPSVIGATAQANVGAAGPAWTWPVTSSFPNFSMCIDPLISPASYFMDIDAFTTTEPMAVGVYNPFYLDQVSLPANWLAYWAGRGVNGPSGNMYAWQDQMWLVINGSQPFFYIYYDGSDYKLIDGLQYQLGGGMPNLVVPGDYPDFNYKYNGTVQSTPGCVSNQFSIFFNFNTVPVPTLSGVTPVCKNATETYTTEAGMSNYVWNVNNASVTAGGTSSDNFVTVAFNLLSGAASVSVNYTNADGCTAANPTVFAIQIDNTFPAITCPGNVAVNNDLGVCGAVVTYVAPVGTDNCPNPVTVQTAGLASGATFPVGTTTNIFQVTDGAGNITTCSFTVTVTDTELPVITCPANISVNNDAGVCGAAVNYSVTATDNCPAVVLTMTNGLASGATFPIGTTTVEYEAEDASGNLAMCSFTVTVVDNEAPTIACPANVNVSNDAGICGAVVTYSAPVAADNCPGYTVTQIAGLASGSLFPIGITINTFEVEDASGNTSICSFSVTVNDTELPSISCASDVTVGNDLGVCGAVVNFSAPVSNDNCPGYSVAQTAGLASGSLFPIGSTVNTFMVTDASMNTAVCSFTVTVNDVEAPQISCPAAYTVPTEPGLCGATVSWMLPAFTDNCPGASISQISGPVSGTFFAPGAYTVVFEAIDAAMNTTQCSVTFTVADQELPVVTCPIIAQPYNTDIGTCSAQLGFIASATDNCPNPVVSYWIAGNPVTWPYNFPLGWTTITAMATDASGNTATCSFSIQVVDNQAPVVYTPTMAAFYNTDIAECDATLMFWATSYDYCDGANSTMTYWIGANQIFFPYDFLPGTTTVIAKATDAAGNWSTGTFDVIVVDDQAPVIVCPSVASSYFTDLNECHATLGFAATATDNCTYTITYTVNGNPISFPYNFPVGMTTVVATATDNYNNTDDCSFVVTVIDNQIPVVTCPTAAPMYSTDAGVCHAALSFSATVIENCTYTVTYSIAGNPISFPYNFPVGTTVVDVAVLDASLNSANCSFNVYVQDNEAPSILCLVSSYAHTTDPGMCGASKSFSVYATDNCGATVSYAIGMTSITFPYFFPVGVTTVVATAVDAQGNTATCSWTVTISDNEVPVITCPVVMGSYPNDYNMCSASLSFTANSSDNCSSIITYSVGGSPITFPYVFPVGSTVVTATATDPANNSSSCTFTVVVVDTEYPGVSVMMPPVSTFPVDPGMCTKSFDVSALSSSTDNCGSTLSYLVGTTPVTSWPYLFPIGTSIVTVTATDAAMNATSVTLTIIITDAQAPVITCPTVAASYLADAGECNYTATFAATAVDNCSYTIEYFVGSNLITFPYDFPVGSTTVTAVATDLAMNSDACTFTVVVLDNQVPVITCPTPSNPYNNDPTHCDATLNLPATATDNCAIASIKYYVGVNEVTMPFTFPVGTTTVVVIATDVNANTAQCQYDVTVVDVQAPTVLCPTVAPSYNTDAGVCTSTQTFVAIPLDNCVATVAYTVGGNAITMPYAFPVGATTVLATASDLAGNTGTCSFVVNVVDNQPPTITCPANVNAVADAGLCSASGVVLGTPVVNDNCGTPTVTNNAPSVFPVGTTLVTWTVTDANSLTATCVQTVVVTDTQAPVLTCPSVFASYNNTTGQCYATLSFAATATDNCGGMITFSYKVGMTNIAFPYNFPVGSTVVDVTATDANMNSATCSFTVVVVDAEAPVITITGSNPVNLCLYHTYTDAGATAMDNCSGNLTTSIVTTGTVDNNTVGTYTITYTVADAAGNTAVATRTVNVISCGAPVSGDYNYHNTALTPISGVTIELMQANVVKYTTTTGANGEYNFPYVEQGIYDVRSSSTKPTNGAINALDAGMVNAWGVSSYTIEKVRFVAADVLKDDYIDAGDAARINNYYLTLGTPTWAAPVGLWSFWRANESINANPFTEGVLPTITVGLVPLTQDFFGLVTGDFNRSFTPAAKLGSGMMLNEGSRVLITPNSEISLPVVATQNLDVAAMSMVLNFPTDKVEILDVYLNNNPAQPVPFNVVNNQLRISWFNGTSINVSAGQPVYTLRVRINGNVVKGDVIRFTLANDPLNEMGDAAMVSISNVDLTVNVLEATATGINPIDAAEVGVNVYPNPFNGSALVNYVLPVDGNVNIEVYDLVGQKVAVLHNAYESAGSYTLPFDSQTWGTGVYMLRIRLESGTETLSRTLRIVSGK